LRREGCDVRDLHSGGLADGSDSGTKGWGGMHFMWMMMLLSGATQVEVEMGESPFPVRCPHSWGREGENLSECL
jgi:hypothetical protein